MSVPELDLPAEQRFEVAVLIATYNSAAFIAAQMASLRENKCRFTLHWLDDHSTDATREAVPALAARLGIEIKAWPQPAALGVPGVFFELLECVSADLYLFCDHDDVWQPGKIDATVAALIADVARPTLCYSEPWVFQDRSPGDLRRYYELRGTDSHDVRAPSRAFMLNPAVGNTIGFTKPLRDLFLLHRDVARSHAAMHDWWMYLLALGAGVALMLENVPTTLYRQHPGNTVGIAFGGRKPTLSLVWRKQQHNRCVVARQAAGFLSVVASMTPSAGLNRLMATAKLVRTLDRRQSLWQVAGLLRLRALQLPWRRALWLMLVALFSDARLYRDNPKPHSSA